MRKKPTGRPPVVVRRLSERAENGEPGGMALMTIRHMLHEVIFGLYDTPAHNTNCGFASGLTDKSLNRVTSAADHLPTSVSGACFEGQ